MDINEEEKAKGKTVEVGRATFDTDKKRLTVFDAPGHKNYVPNMIQGAACADFGALVISAKRGEFESGFDLDGQTREHAQLAKSLGMQKLIVVVNKMDESTVKWSKERYQEIKDALTPFLATCGFNVEKDVHWVPVSGISGDNIKDTVDKKVCNWYNGPSFIQLLDELELPKRDPDGPIRIPILDRMKDRGIVVFGKVESGTVRMGEKLTLMPSNTPTQVANVYNSKSEPVKYAKPGENVQLRLLHINDENLINKGDVLCNRDAPMPVSELFEAEVEILELLSYKPILSKGYTCVLHVHTVAEECIIKDIMTAYEKNDKGEVVEKVKPQFTKSFAKMICRIQMRVPIPIEKHDTLEVMGRFTLRDEGKTIALGKIIKYKPVKVTAQAAVAEDAKVTEVKDKTGPSQEALVEGFQPHNIVE
jgi:peptide chain release factor subunit 3